MVCPSGTHSDIQCVPFYWSQNRHTTTTQLVDYTLFKHSQVPGCICAVVMLRSMLGAGCEHVVPIYAENATERPELTGSAPNAYTTTHIWLHISRLFHSDCPLHNPKPAARNTQPNQSHYTARPNATNSILCSAHHGGSRLSSLFKMSPQARGSSTSRNIQRVIHSTHAESAKRDRRHKTREIIIRTRRSRWQSLCLKVVRRARIWIVIVIRVREFVSYTKPRVQHIENCVPLTLL